ncbi:MAG: YfhO family protein [Elusimicrobia bacterium]|nr:YfhO family protein [Elusimicrobiota bacterium]
MSFLKRYWPYLASAGLAAAILPEVVFLGKIFVGDNDRLVQEIPFLHLAAETLRRHALPYWNSYAFCGHAGIGQPNLRLFYPLTFLIAWLCPSHLMRAASWRIVLEIFLALALYYRLFLKVWGDEALALFSSLATSLSSIMILFWCEGYVPFYFPALVLSVLWDWERRDMRLNVLGLALSLYLLISGTFFQYTAYFLPILFLVSAARALAGETPARSSARLAALWVAGFGLAALLAAPDLVPFLADFRGSNRQHASFEMIYGAWAPPLFSAFRIFLPHFLGDHGDWNANLPLIEGNSQLNLYEVFPAYAGIATVLFCAVAALRPTRRDAWPWLCLIGLLSLCALRTPFLLIPYALFLKAPLLHGRLASAIPLCMAFLAPVGIRRFLEEGPRFKAASAALLGALTLLVWAFAGGRLGETLSLAGWIGTSASATPGTATIAERCRRAGDLFLLGGGIVTFLAFAHWRARLSASRFKYALAAVLALDLVGFARAQTIIKRFRDEASWYPPARLTEFLRGLPDRDVQRIAITPGVGWADMPDMAYFSPNVNIPYGLRVVDGYANLIDGRYAELASRGAGMFRGSRTNIVSTPVMADLLAAKYVVVPNAPDAVSAQSAFSDKVFETETAVVFAKRGALARWRLVCRTEAVADAAVAVLSAAARPGFSLRETALVPEGSPLRLDGARCADLPRAALELRETRPGLIEGKVRAEAPALLVVTETYARGWRATVGGRPAAVHRVNYAFQGIEVPSGESAVALSYRPAGIGWAFAAAAAAALTLLGLAAASFLARR